MKSCNEDVQASHGHFKELMKKVNSQKYLSHLNQIMEVFMRV